MNHPIGLPAVDVPFAAEQRPEPSPRVRVVSWTTLRADLLAGLTVAAISLPQSIAYALIAGVDPRFGLYAAIVFCAVASALGSSRHLINGPTGAVSLVVFSALAFLDPSAPQDMYEALFLLGAMAGIVQIGIAVARLGDLTHYISESVVTGFIAGAASLTIIGQVSNALGLKAQGTGHQHVLVRLWLTLTQGVAPNPRAVAITLASIVLAVLARHWVKRLRLPQLDMLAVLLLVCVVAWALGWTEHGAGVKPAVALTEAVPASLPRFHIPDIEWHWFADLSGSAFAVGILGLLETLAIAKAVALQSGQRLDYNRQILAEGVGNLAGAFFRAMPGAGSLSRTAINYSAGAASRLSGVFTAVFVGVVVLTLGPLTAHIPKSALAGLLIVAAARLIDLGRLRHVLRCSRYDAALLVITALSAVLVDVEFAILIGVAASLAGYLPRAARIKARELVVSGEHVVRERLPDETPANDLLILDIEGELYFGAAPEFEQVLADARRLARERGVQHLVLRLRRARNPDIVAVEVLLSFLQSAHASGLTVFLAGVRQELKSALERAGAGSHLVHAQLFPEEDQLYSATLKAIHAALDAAGVTGQARATARREARHYQV